jgi:predicted short-subunit dehydrogenase-like oxidoreductase (DUF2520 family)
MRELERDLPASNPTRAALTALAIVGAGRAGRSIAKAARDAGLDVSLHGRGEQVDVPEGGAALLCVPDDAIADACEGLTPQLPPGVPVGHTSGATGLDALAAAIGAGHPAFSLHPLQTIPGPATDLAGAPCAIAGTGGDALAVARSLAETLGMEPFEVPDSERAAYHAAASMASNFLIALEESAAALLEATGVANPREVLAPLVLRTAANWADAGAGALTGPIARGDEATVARHLEAIASRAPQLAPLYEALAERTRTVAREAEGSR